jgi:hypothetical protein
LAEQLLPALAKARAAQRALTGPALMRVERVSIDLDQLAVYLDATPEPARQLLLALVDGASPQALVVSGEASARLIEDVLSDAAVRGAVSGIFDHAGLELLAPATVQETLTLRGIRAPRVVPPPMLLLGEAEASPYLEVDAAELSTKTPPVCVAPPATPAPSSALPATKTPAPRPSAPAPAPALAKSKPAKPSPTPAPAPVDEAPSSRRNTPLPSPYAPSAPAPASSSRASASTWILLAIAGLAFGAAARWTSSPPAKATPIATVESTPPQPNAIAQVAPAAPAPPLANTVAPSTPTTPSAASPGPEDLPLPAGEVVPMGKGLLEVVAGPSDLVFVDRRPIGQGPIVKLPLAPRREPYEIRVKLRGEERVRFVSIKEGRLARLQVTPPWSR